MFSTSQCHIPETPSHSPGDIPSPTRSPPGPGFFSSSSGAALVTGGTDHSTILGCVTPKLPAPSFDLPYIPSTPKFPHQLPPQSQPIPLSISPLPLSLLPNYHPTNLPGPLSYFFNPSMDVHFVSPANSPSHCSPQEVASPYLPHTAHAKSLIPAIPRLGSGFTIHHPVPPWGPMGPTIQPFWAA